jgi:hypothetical protein
MTEKIPCESISFVKNEEFWCNCCDGNKVHSDKPETGKFFRQHGHRWDVSKRETTEDYVMVIFAICTDCLKFGPIDLNLDS